MVLVLLLLLLLFVFDFVFVFLVCFSLFHSPSSLLKYLLSWFFFCFILKVWCIFFRLSSLPLLLQIHACKLQIFVSLPSNEYTQSNYIPSNVLHYFTLYNKLKEFSLYKKEMKTRENKRER